MDLSYLSPLVLVIVIHMTNCLLEDNYSIAVLHMRKAAGSQILGFITDWMRINNCFHHPLLYVSTDGIQNGKSLQELDEIISPIPLPTPCPYINVVHEEFKSIDGKLLRKLISSRISYQVNISFITTLRDPIDRIGSQAFYGPGNIAFNTFHPALVRQCNISINKDELLRSLKS